jgi:16S rRNA (adenine1518-N6/adenine1519-N6)-dimethyltransferase
MTLTRRRIAELLEVNGLAPSRALGQNFVADPNTVRRIVRLAGVGPGDHVVEIGPGLGSLTLALAESGADVLAVEVDRHVLPVLRAVLDDAGAAAPAGRVRLVHADATAADWSELLAGVEPWVLVANLPYNVATPLVLDLLDAVPAIQRMLVMVQLEVGERLAAGAGDKIYGIPSVKVAYHGTARIVGKVSPEVFVPRPRVGSALVEIRRHLTPPAVADVELLFRLVRTAFGQRRKMLRRSLVGLVTPSTFEAAGIDPETRPEQLDLAAWIRLTDAVSG